MGKCGARCVKPPKINNLLWLISIQGLSKSGYSCEGHIFPIWPGRIDRICWRSHPVSPFRLWSRPSFLSTAISVDGGNPATHTGPSRGVCRMCQPSSNSKTFVCNILNSARGINSRFRVKKSQDLTMIQRLWKNSHLLWRLKFKLLGETVITTQLCTALLIYLRASELGILSKSPLLPPLLRVTVIEPISISLPATAFSISHTVNKLTETAVRASISTPVLPSQVVVAVHRIL